jgi:hypothetical protein
VFEELDLLIGEVMGFMHLGNAATDGCNTVGKTCLCTKPCNKTLNNCPGTDDACSYNGCGTITTCATCGTCPGIYTCDTKLTCPG